MAMASAVACLASCSELPHLHLLDAVPSQPFLDLSWLVLVTSQRTVLCVGHDISGTRQPEQQQDNREPRPGLQCQIHWSWLWFPVPAASLHHGRTQGDRTESNFTVPNVLELVRGCK